jgi:hypothetical protein
MPIPSDVGLTFRLRAPEVYERGVAHTTRLEARIGGSLVAPSSGTFTLYDPGGSVVYTGSVTISSSVATITVPALSLPDTLSFGDSYREEWVLVESGRTVTGRREAYVARKALHCPVTQADLEAVHPRLATTMGNAASSLQGFIDEAWADTLVAMVSTGQWPEAIVEPTQLRVFVRELSLYYVFRSLLTGSGVGADRYQALSDEHKGRADTAWAGVRYRQDFDQDGVADDEERKSPGGGIVSRSGAPNWYYGAHNRRRVL